MKTSIGLHMALTVVAGTVAAQTPNASPQPPEPAPLNRAWNVRDHIPLDQFIIPSRPATNGSRQ